jgi:hypothetical protein
MVLESKREKYRKGESWFPLPFIVGLLQLPALWHDPIGGLFVVLFPKSYDPCKPSVPTGITGTNVNVLRDETWCDALWL